MLKNSLKKEFVTKQNTAFFWSGKTNGIGYAENAEEIAEMYGGTTLEMLIKKEQIVMPVWESSVPDSVTTWKQASRWYAEQASGIVYAIIGQNTRKHSVWADIEFPTLKNNPKVTQIVFIDPASKQIVKTLTK